MGSSTDLVVAGGFDLTRSPEQQWAPEMVALVTKQLFRNMNVSVTTVQYCLAIAESLELNPLIGEVYFIPSKSKDGKGPAYQPYIGRNGLVARAQERGYYYEAETVYKNDRIRINRRKNGDVEVVHSYDPTEDRGVIAGAYAFLHRVDGSERPGFFYAKWESYRPEFDAEWKWNASPWGNQSEAMIEKCAMIGAGRKRLRLGNVLIDGEIARYEQMGEAGPRTSLPPADVAEFPFEELTEDEDLAERLRTGAAHAGWSQAKVELVMRGRSHDELVAIADRFGAEGANQAATQATPAAPGPAEGSAPGGGSEPGSDGRGAQDGSEEVADAVVVPPEPIDHEKVRGLEKRKAGLEDSLNDPTLLEDDRVQIGEELDSVEKELAAALDPGQSNLFG